MAATKLSLTIQREKIERCLALLESLTDGEHADDIAGGRQGCLSLAWFERRSELTRELVRLDKEAPHLAQMLKDEPGAHIVDVRPRPRPIMDEFFNDAPDD